MNPFKEIWFNTERCIDYFLIKENRRPYLDELVWIQALLAGVTSFIEDKSGLGLSKLILAPVVVVLSLRYFVPWILWKTGRLVNGKGTKADLRMVVSISCIPYSLVFPFLFLWLIISGKGEPNIGAIELIVWICVWRILIIGVAKAQKISYVFALMNIVIPTVFAVVVYLLIRF